MTRAREHMTVDCLDSFARVYDQARSICLDIDDASSHRPMDAVVRFRWNGEAYEWRLDSGLYSNEDTLLKFSLDDFDQFFGESYGTATEITDADMRDFAALDTENY